MVQRKTRVNKAIRVPEVRLIDEEGNQIGVIPTSEALAIAQGKGLDLVEVAPKNRPPVCRVMDYGKYLYQQNKRQRESKKTHAAKKVKEIKIRAKIEKHDLDFKIKHIRTFLGKNFKVKVTVIYRGREITHTEIGRELVAKVIAALGDEAVVESAPKMEGRALIAVLAPAPKKARKKPAEIETETAETTAGTPAFETDSTLTSETSTPSPEDKPEE